MKREVPDNFAFAAEAVAIGASAGGIDALFALLQDRALGLFHESLAHRGFLGLGSKESLDFSHFVDKFEPVSRRDRLFRKT